MTSADLALDSCSDSLCGALVRDGARGDASAHGTKEPSSLRRRVGAWSAAGHGTDARGATQRVTRDPWALVHMGPRREPPIHHGPAHNASSCSVMRTDREPHNAKAQLQAVSSICDSPARMH